MLVRMCIVITLGDDLFLCDWLEEGQPAIRYHRARIGLQGITLQGGSGPPTRVIAQPTKECELQALLAGRDANRRDHEASEMAKIRISPPEHFTFSRPEEWTKWVRQFEHFRQASGGKGAG